MTTPDWLGVGTVLVDGDDDRWMINDVGPKWVTVENPDRGRHRVLRDDLVAWVREGDWTTV
jgi:hypothetical protein